MGNVRVDKTSFRVTCSGPNFQRDLNILKGITGRRYDPSTKEWIIPRNEENENLLGRFGMVADVIEDDSSPINSDWENVPIPQNLSFLRPWQQTAFKYTKKRDYRAFIAMDMGLGKTLTSLVLALDSNSYPALVVCPANVKEEFEKDNRNFLKNYPQVEILSGRDSLRTYTEKKIYVCNYEILSTAVDKITRDMKQKDGSVKKVKVMTPSEGLKDFHKSNFQIIIGDEAHRIKNEESSAYFAIRYLSENVPHVLFMSGTPILSRPKELFNALNILDPKTWNNRYAYYNKFCGPKDVWIGRGRKTRTYDGSSNEPLLHKMLTESCLIRIKKTDVMKDLPMPTKIVLPFEVKNYQQYLNLEKAIEEAIKSDPSMILTKFEKLKQKAVELKMNYVFDWIDDALESEEKILIFAEHRSTVDAICNKYNTKANPIFAVPYNGDVTPANKSKHKQLFMNDPNCRILVGNTLSLGVGVDGIQKSGCSTIAFIELPWNPAYIDQGISRLWRSGYDEKTYGGIMAYFLIAKNTIEEDMVDLLDMKSDTVIKVIDGVPASEDTFLRELMKKRGSKA